MTWHDTILLVISCFWLQPRRRYHSIFIQNPRGSARVETKGREYAPQPDLGNLERNQYPGQGCSGINAKLHALSAELVSFCHIIKKFVFWNSIPIITNSVILFISVGVSSYSCTAAICQHIIFNNISQNKPPMHTETLEITISKWFLVWNSLNLFSPPTTRSQTIPSSYN